LRSWSSNGRKLVHVLKAGAGGIVRCRQPLSGWSLTLSTRLGRPPDSRYRPEARVQEPSFGRARRARKRSSAEGDGCAGSGPSGNKLRNASVRPQCCRSRSSPVRKECARSNCSWKKSRPHHQKRPFNPVNPTLPLTVRCVPWRGIMRHGCSASARGANGPKGAGFLILAVGLIGG
jgi:hypothetical protein